MTTLAPDRTQISVRVERRAVDLLDDRIIQARRAGQKVTKEQLVSEAIIATYGNRPRRGWLPEHPSVLLVRADPRSSTALLDLQDEAESAP